MAAEYTIDELARAAGTTVRSVRVYHERGVLPPPQVKGRTGYYGAEHLTRVQTISRLLDRGIKLNGIKELLGAWGRGEGLGEVLGVNESSETPTFGARALDSASTVASTELEGRYSDVVDGLARVVALGLYEPVNATTYRVGDRHSVDAAESLMEFGVSPTDAVDALERLRVDCDRIARRFVALLHHAHRSRPDSDHDRDDRTEFDRRLQTVSVMPGALSDELVTRLIAGYLERDALSPDEVGSEVS